VCDAYPNGLKLRTVTDADAVHQPRWAFRNFRSSLACQSWYSGGTNAVISTSQAMAWAYVWQSICYNSWCCQIHIECG
jgi:hypothetical protein